jgi:chromosome partitioning protein
MENKNELTPKMSISQAAKFLGISVQAVHKQLKAKHIKVPRISNKSYIDYSVAKNLFGIKFKQKFIAGQIVKGGTGKTTSIDHISSCANTYGARVLKIDSDPQGNLSDVNNIDADEMPVLVDVLDGNSKIEDCIVNISEGLDIIPSRIENVILDTLLLTKKYPLDKFYANILKPIINNYDFIFIDCPPFMGPSVTTASLFVDTILVPLNPDKFSTKGLAILRREVDSLMEIHGKNIDFKVFLNKFSNKTLLSDKAVMNLFSDPGLDGKVLSSTIPFAQEIPNIIDENKNLFCSLKKSTTREDFDSLTRELLKIEIPVHKEEVNKSALMVEMESA